MSQAMTHKLSRLAWFPLVANCFRKGIILPQRIVIGYDIISMIRSNYRSRLKSGALLSTSVLATCPGRYWGAIRLICHLTFALLSSSTKISVDNTLCLTARTDYRLLRLLALRKRSSGYWKHSKLVLATLTQRTQSPSYSWSPRTFLHRVPNTLRPPWAVDKR